MDRASDYGSEGWGFNSLRARHHHMGHPAAVQELKARLAGARAVDGLLRPHIVWFGESLDPVDVERSFSAVRSCEVLLIIGTSGIVYPAASFASFAKEAGAFVAEINLDPTPNTQIVDIAIQGRAKDIIPLLL